MNNRFYRLVFNRLRGMLIAVAETAAAQGKAGQGETSGSSVRRCATLFRMRHAAFAALALWGLAPVLSGAQVVPSGAHAPGALNTANGIQQVNITKPSGAGVSLNTYSQFDVPRAGVILNNSPTLVQTQQAGYINGNPNFGAGDAARIIVNQVNSSNPSQLRGYVEVAGQKTATVVIANSSGLVVDGGGFINTTRGILTTGNPVIDASGNLTGFNVTQGTITVQGAGFNASNIDEVDLLSRAVQANAAVYGNTLHVVTGANSIDYASLNPTPIAGSGGAPGVSVDVAQLGGMYANRIVLVGTENGVGVANAGTIAAQAGDLTLTSAGQLVQSGTMEASGNIGINAASVVNAGTVYAQQSTTIGSAGAVTNSGTLAAQQNTSINAGSVNSTGTLGAGVNGDGTVGSSGDLTVSASGQVSATRLNVAGGNASFSGSGVSVAGSETAANGNVSLGANAGDLNLAGATTSAGGSVNAQASGTLINDRGSLTAGGGATLVAGSISNQGGSVSAQGTLTAQASGQIANQGGEFISQGAMQVRGGSIANNQGTMQSAAGLSVAGASLDNTAGKIGTFAASNGWAGDVTITTTGAVIGTNGQIGAAHNLTVDAATLTGGGAYSAANDVAVNVQGNFALTSGFQFSAGHDLAFTLPGTFTNAATLAAANNLDVNASDINNSGSMMAGGTLTTHSSTLENSGAIVGGSVSLNATSTIANIGPGALIGATDRNGTLELLAPDIENRDDTTATDTQATTAIYGLGKVVLAGGKDASGNYTNANLIDNVSALIQSAGDMALHANQVTNTRRVMTTSGGYTSAVDPALLAQLGISLSGCTAAYMAACGPGNPQVRGIEFNPTASDYNPAVIAALQAGTGGMPTNPPHGGQWNSTYQYTTYTGVALGNLVTGISPQAQIISGGNLNASSVGTFGNYWSAVAAAGNIAAPVSLDQNSWHGQMAPGVQVTYSGQYHYDNYDNTEYNWQLPFGNAGFVTGHPGGYTQAAPADVHTYALPSYESSFVAGGTLSGTGVSINNTAGNAGLTSLGLVAGQSVAAVNIGTSSVQGHGGLVNPVIAAATAVNVLSNLTIPQGGLFRRDTAPNAPYLIESNPAFTSQKSFISSDYFLNQLGYNPQTVEKRLGDGMYEQQLVQNQVTSLTGKAVPGPYTDTQSMYEAMMASGAALSKQLELPLGMALSADQVAALTSNVVILQTEVVDGQSVLVPVVYLAKASQQNMQGPLIAATDIDLQNAQTFSNSGTVQASNSLTIEGKSIDNTFGTLKSGGLMSLTTTGDVNFTSATVNAGSVALNAGGNLLLDTATSTVNQVSASGATRTTTTLGPIANLNVAGNAAIVTGGNFEQNAGNLNVGGALGMSIGGNWDLGSVQTGEHKVVARANGVSNTEFNTATGSTVKVGGVSEI
ncbi:filamentous hemagglutinin N-terminal domain-containing protein, partial [Paraburkholderia sp. BR14261]